MPDELDPIDEQIIETLSRDARATNAPSSNEGY
jgi:DNA-binding Lrp family transcriptional regulator